VNRRPSASSTRGLTLIELVITLTILALAGALVSGAFATGLRAWRSGLVSGREELVARIVLERIAAQLRAAVPAPAKRGEADAIAFDAAEDHLRFVTLAAAGDVPVQVYFGLQDAGGDARLVYREHPWPDKHFFDGGRPHREEEVPEVTGLSVKLTRRSDKKEGGDAAAEPEPREWSPLDRELPQSVKVEIVVNSQGSPEPRRYRTTVTIPTQAVP
jgi:prepilin-type N-terminal cleavage/methylation domain-containing protein